MIHRVRLVVGVALLAAIPIGVRAAIQPSFPEVEHFLDTSRGTALTVHSDPTDPEYGTFSFSISGVGTYAGGNAQSIRQKAAGGGVVINFKGESILFPESDASLVGVVRRIIMNAQVGPKEGHATASLADKSERGGSYQMVSHAPPGNAKQTVSMVEAALESGDWAALYSLSSSTLTSAITLEEFISELTAQEADVGSVIAVDVLSKPEIEFSAHGMWFFSVRVLITFDVDGTLEQEEFVDYYILEAGEWRLWFSAVD